MSLDGIERTARGCGNFIKRHLTEEAQGHHLTVGLPEGGHGLAHRSLALVSEHDGKRIGAGCTEDELGAELHGLASLPKASERLAGRDAQEPAPERALAPVRRDRSVRHHERLLSNIFGIMGSAQDPQADAVDHPLLPLDKEPERVAISGEHGIHQGAVIHACMVPCRRRQPCAGRQLSPPPEPE